MARAVVSAGANYIDLADGRDFEAGISQLDESARERGVFVTSGASSLPALSSAVVDKYLHRFTDWIRFATVSPRVRGLAAIRGVFGYCGEPLPRSVVWLLRAPYLIRPASIFRVHSAC